MFFNLSDSLVKNKEEKWQEISIKYQYGKSTLLRKSPSSELELQINKLHNVHLGVFKSSGVSLSLI